MAISTADRPVVNEATAAQVTVSAYDLAGDNVAPGTLHYRIDDIKSGTAVKALTPIATPGLATAIPLTPEDNAILNPMLKEEPKRLTVITDKDSATDKAQAQYTYYVKNISYS
jgi:hypothetical protein